jgi:hypothetical protein
MPSTPRFLLSLATTLLIGCASPSGTSAKPRPTTRPATTRPTNETFTVDLAADAGPFTPRARGLLRLKPSVQPTREMLAPLGPLAQGEDGGEPPVLVTLGESVKYDGAFPGDKGNWTKWDQGVEKLVRQQLTAATPTIYELWKEPDKSGFNKERTNFLGAWVHTARLIRGIDPKAVLMGPSISKHDGGWTGEFLKVAKEYGVLPDVVCWHEENLKQDISGHVSQAGEAFWQDGTDRQRVLISAAAGVDDKNAAGDVPIFLAQVEKSVRDQSWRPLTWSWAFKLSHLFTNDAKPRSIYYAYKEYADLANAGRNAKTSSSPSVDGLGLWSEPTKTARLLLGRNRSRLDSKQVPGEVTVLLKGANAATAHVRARRIPNTGANPAADPLALPERDLPVHNGEIRIPLPDFASGDVYVIEVTLRGQPMPPSPK